MRRKPVVITIVLLTLIGAGVMHLAANPADKTEMQPAASTTPTNTTDTATEPTDSDVTPPTAVPGAYINYTDDSIASTSGTKLLFFHAPWCPQCRALEADITENGVPDGVTIIKVDYDSSQSLRAKYGVTLQTTIVKVDDAGELVAKYVAYNSPTVEAVKMNLL